MLNFQATMNTFYGCSVVCQPGAELAAIVKSNRGNQASGNNSNKANISTRRSRHSIQNRHNNRLKLTGLHWLCVALLA
jgi:hypothetical protein